MGNEVPNRDLVKRARGVGALVVFLAAAVVLAAAFLVARAVWSSGVRHYQSTGS